MARRLHGGRFWRVGLAVAAAAALGVAAVLSQPAAARLLARWHLSRAEAMLQQGDDAGGAAELAAALKRDPLQGRARLLLGELQLRRGRLARAFLDLQAYSEAFPDDPEGWAALARVRSAAAQPEEAEAALGSALELAPARADLRLARAGLRLKIGRFHGALLDARAVPHDDPRAPEAAAIAREATAQLEGPPCAPPALPRPGTEAGRWPGELGGLIGEFVAALHRRNWNAAGALVSRARSDFPGSLLGPWLDGVLSLSFGALEHAEDAFGSALAVAPRSHRPLSNLVALWSRQKGPGYTADQLMRLFDRDRGFTYVLPIAAAAYLEDSRPSKGEATIRALFRALPSSPLPAREVARFFLQLDRPSDAIAVADEGLARFPADADLLRAQARAYLKLGDREGALRSWEAAVRARGDDQAATAQLARLLVSLRKDAPSRQRALSLVRGLACDAPADAEVLGAVGAVLLEAAGDPAAARPWLEAARDRAPEAPGLRYQLALAYARGQDAPDARRELQQALRSGQAFDDEPEARRLLQQLGGP